MSSTNPVFSRLRLSGWRQFASIDIEFHRRLTVLTCANGAGKSTILNILSRHLGVERPYLASPAKAKSGPLKFFVGLFEAPWLWTDWKKPNPSTFGEIKYSNGATSYLVAPTNEVMSYTLGVQNQQRVVGFHVPSHRMLPIHQSVPTIPFAGINPNEALGRLLSESYPIVLGGRANTSVMFRLKELLAAWAAIGEGNTTINSDPVQRQAYLGFVDVLRKIIPPEIGFISLVIRPPEVLLETETGTFLIDAASGGLVMLIELAALIYACSINSDVSGGPFVVSFDEPENHLHPSFQRFLLPRLLDAFPATQFIVATHSPFMVSSVKDSNVYVLRYVDADNANVTPPTVSRWVESVRLDYVNRAGTASEILRDVLGVPVTLPAWVEKELSMLVSRYESEPMNDSTLSALKTDLGHAGLGELFSEALVKIGHGR